MHEWSEEMAAATSFRRFTITLLSLLSFPFSDRLSVFSHVNIRCALSQLALLSIRHKFCLLLKSICACVVLGVVRRFVSEMVF